MRGPVVILTVLLSSCTGWGTSQFDCVDDGVDRGLAAAARAWPEVADIPERLDLMCLPLEDLQDREHCDNPTAECCTMWLGGKILARARIYASTTESARACAIHELAHARTNPCLDHDPACWAEVEALIEFTATETLGGSK